MLIHAVRGENFMKFRNIHLEGFPERGLIGIEGRNEGGKSTIGELVQFALFGKSLSTRESSVVDLIHWEHDHCMVELDFSLGTPSPASPPELVAAEAATFSREYRIWREIDRYGTNFARLVRLDDRQEIASGTIQVQERLDELLHFDFDDFRRSFFLAEREFPRSPEKLREYLDRMLGTEILAKVEQDVRKEVADLEETFGRLQAEIHRNTQQIERYIPNIARIPEVETQRDAHAAKADEFREDERRHVETMSAVEATVKEREGQRERIRSLKDRPAAKLSSAVEHLLRGYPDDPPEVLEPSRRDLEKIRGRLGKTQELAEIFKEASQVVEKSLAVLTERLGGQGAKSISTRRTRLEGELRRATRRRRSTLVFAVVFLGLAALSGLGGGAEQGQWLGRSLLGDGGVTSWASLYAGAGICLFLSLALALGRRHHGRSRTEILSRLSNLEGEEKSLAAERVNLERFSPQEVRIDDVVQRLSESRVDEVKEVLARYRSAYESLVGEDDDLGGFANALADEEHRVLQRLRARAKELTKTKNRLHERQKREQSKRDRAESEIREYQKQEGRLATLEEQNKDLDTQAAEIRSQLETRQLLMQLLEEVIESVRHRAGPSLGKTLKRLLPHLTGGRYSDIQITPDFRMRVFTSEKSDFLQNHELSGGTFEALSLGFRLAFSQAFIRAVTHCSQFIFLDEPFKAMDRSRIRSTLEVLTRLSGEISQVFVILPGIPEQERALFDARIQTHVGQPELIVRLGGKTDRTPRVIVERASATPPESDLGAKSLGRTWLQTGDLGSGSTRDDDTSATESSARGTERKPFPIDDE